MSKEQENEKALEVNKKGAKTTSKVVKSSSDESGKKPAAKKPAAKKPAAKKPAAKKPVTKKPSDEIVLVDSKDESNSLTIDLKETSSKKPRTVKTNSDNVDNATIDNAIIDNATIIEEKLEEEYVVLEEDQEEAPFDWEAYESTSVERSEDLVALEKMYEDTLMTSVEHQLVSGKVVNVSDRDVIIDINSKSEGVVSLNEFRYNPDLKVGDIVEVLVDKQEDKLGQLVLSHRKARSIKAWDRVNEAFGAEEIVQGFVKCRTKGGMIVDIFGLEAFLPGSQIDVKPIRDYDVYVEKTMEFKIVKINHEFKNVVVSHKALIEADLEEQKKVIIGQLEKGQVLEGIVKNITSYGVFIDLGGVDGLVHITDLSWSRINHPSEVVELDQKINVVILDFDEAKTRIQLGLKQLFPHPWEALDSALKEGDKVKGKVAVLADYGAFIEVASGVEGLIHVSEMSWGSHLRSAQDFFSVGDAVDAVVLSIDREERKMSLGVKQLTPDPWTDITAKYIQGSIHNGKVRNFTNFGVFLELEEGIDGLVHISDLSWTKKVKHPSEFTSVGAELEVQVLDIDVENRRLSLGHKQVLDNPWDNYASIFELKSTHKGEVKSAADKGFNIWFADQDLEVYCPARHSLKEDGSSIGVGEQLDFIVIEFNSDTRRILVSHTQNFKNVLDSAEGPKKKSKSSGKNSGVKAVNAALEKTTLGDLDSLARLKEEMDGKK
jgi:small subunit ribosomal protein S1